MAFQRYILLAFRRLRRDSRFRRYVLLWTAGIILAGILATAVILTAGGLASTGVVLGWATLLLAVIAGLVALLAYAATTGLPNLDIQIWFPFSYANLPVFRADPVGEAGSLYARQFKQTTPEIRVRNTSNYSARNPAVVIHLRGMAFSPNEQSAEWTQIDFVTTVGITGMQWDGGAYSIHGHSVRRLPWLDLDRLHTVPAWGEPKFIIELLAEGYRREVEIPARFTTDDGDREWGKELPASEQPPLWR